MAGISEGVPEIISNDSPSPIIAIKKSMDKLFHMFLCISKSLQQQ